VYALDNKDQEILVDIENNIFICCDPQYLSQALDNILINAIQYCADGLIKVSLIKVERNIQIEVADSGIGIEPRELEQIFGVFVVGSKTYSKAGGRGLGLAMCRAVARAHGGDITAYSNGVKGSTFKIVLPL
jgi:signal transduction histidine kinase